MIGKTCFFMGNRYTPSSVIEPLIQAIETHITEYGVKTFIVGHYGNFDSMVIVALRKAKKRHTDIELYLLAPYALNQKIKPPKEFDGTLYPEGMEMVPKPLAIVQANRKIVEQSDYLISYCHHPGNTEKIVAYAQRRGKKGLIKVTLL